jgi:Rieske Fe-S protein
MRPITPNPVTSRRGFLNALTGLLVAILALLLVLPAIGYILSPLWRRRGSDGGKEDFVDLGPVTALPVGEWRRLPLETVQEDGWRKTSARHAVWVRRQGEGERDLVVLSSICPHLGCPVSWQPGQSKFLCPCHGGQFDSSGQRTAGPSPRDLDPLEWEVRSGRLFVRWQDFKIGVDKRIAVEV